MQNKKLEAKRLVLFLLFAFGIAWIPAIALTASLVLFLLFRLLGI